MKNNPTNGLARNTRSKGYSLIEFLVAMAVFMTVTGSVFALFRKDDPLFNQQQGVSGLNIALQNSITQLQVDAVNAGSGYYTGTNIPNFPVGITLKEYMVANVPTNPPVGDCGDNATFLYHADCFDTLNIIATDPATPPMHAAIGTNTTSGTMVVTMPGLTNAQAITQAAKYKTGDQLLLVNVDGSMMTTVTLTGATPATVSGTNITITYTAQTTAGVNPGDTLLMTTNNGAADNGHTQLTNLFSVSAATDWVLRLQPIVYSVDDTDPSNPKLTRKVGTAAADVIAEQIVGFKVGASLWNNANQTDGTYVYDASHFGNGFDFSIIRSIRVSVIGRTAPNATGTNTFRNTYDTGPYQIQGLSVVINPRNLSM